MPRTPGKPIRHGMPVTVQPLQPSRETLSMLVEASRDSALTHNTYLPEHLTPTKARHWVSQQPDTTWVIYYNGEPVGLAQMSTNVDTGEIPAPAGSRETETWILESFRGRGIASQAWRHIFNEIATTHPDITHAVGVVWVENTASSRRLLKDGYTLAGKTWWGDQRGGGWCYVFARPTR